MARHYSDSRKSAYRSAESKRRDIREERKQERRNKEARRKFEGGL